MRFLSIYKAVEKNVPPTTEEMAAMGQLIEEMTKTGTLVSTEGCLPTARGARVRRSGGRVGVTDGPFTESKEVIAGFAVLEANSKEEAIELTKRFLEVAGDGECEIRQIYQSTACEEENNEPASVAAQR
ncbi:MAG TPA: YciI family protein [Thermoanaerobaculia bacterium]|nr:YciI family protein [Thermoanaerobaculia bacterium]